MSSTVCGLRPGIPNGHSSSSFAFGVSSYRPSSFFLSKSSCVICSSSGYTEPGDGLHHPCVIVSISSMISAPFFGAFARIEMIQVRKPLRRCIIQRKGGNMFVGESYRITDIYPLPLESVFRYRKSDMRKYRPCNTPRGGIHYGKHASESRLESTSKAYRLGDRRAPSPNRHRNCDRSRRPGNRRARRGIRVLPILLLPVRVLHLRLLPVLPVPGSLLGLGRVGLAGLFDVRRVR